MSGFISQRGSRGSNPTRQGGRFGRTVLPLSSCSLPHAERGRGRSPLLIAVPVLSFASEARRARFDHGVAHQLLGQYKSRRKFRPRRRADPLRSAVLKGKTTPLARLASKQKTRDLTRIEHMQWWSLVTYMNCLEPGLWRKLVDGIKGRSPDESELECLFRAMLVAYETDIVTFECCRKRWILWR